MLDKFWGYLLLISLSHIIFSRSLTRFLINMGANVNLKDKMGNTCLHRVINISFLTFVPVTKEIELIISKVNDIDVKNNFGETPLSLALCTGNKEMVELLISKGANVNIKNDDGESILYEAINYDIEIAKLLVNKGARMDELPFHYNAFVNYVNEVSYLINKSNVITKDHTGRSPLHYAALGNSVQVIEFLIVNKFSIDERDNYGNAPISDAVYANSIETAELLINKGCDIQLVDDSKKNLLHKVKSKEMTRLLLNNGLDINATDDLNITPLHEAVSKELSDLVEFLASMGADVNARDNDGHAPLDYLWPYDKETKRILLKYGAKEI